MTDPYIGRTTDSQQDPAEAEFLAWFTGTQGVAVPTEITENDPREDDEITAFFRRLMNGEN